MFSGEATPLAVSCSPLVLLGGNWMLMNRVNWCSMELSPDRAPKLPALFNLLNEAGSAYYLLV